MAVNALMKKSGDNGELVSALNNLADALHSRATVGDPDAKLTKTQIEGLVATLKEQERVLRPKIVERR